MKRDELKFGQLLTEGIRTVGAKSNRSLTAIQREMGEALGLESEIIRYYRKGHVPPDEQRVEYLAYYMMKYGHMNCDWLRDFLTSAGYSDPKTLFAEFGCKPTALKHNLPPRAGVFVGRQSEMTDVLDGLKSRWALICLEGIGGVGKTTLAVEVAYECMRNGDKLFDEPFEAFVFVSAVHSQLTLQDFLDNLIQVLIRPNVIEQITQAQMIHEAEHLLRTQKVLIIADNFETVTDEELWLYLERIPEPSKALITTRFGQLRRAWHVPLKGLAETDAFTMIRQYAQSLHLEEITLVDDRLLAALARVTGGNPYAISIVLGYLKEGQMTLDNLVRALQGADRDVGSIFAYMFDQAWEMLEPAAQSLLMALSFFADSANKQAWQLVADVNGNILDQAIRQLVLLSLVEITSVVTAEQQRFRLHPLTRTFARLKLQSVPEWEQEARQRWGDYYIQFITQSLTTEKPAERYWNTCYSPGEAVAVVDQELANLRGLLAWAVAHQEDKTLVELMMLLSHYLGKRIFPERLRYGEEAVMAARRLGQVNDEALLRIDAVGWLYLETGHYEAAEREIRAGLQIAETIPDIQTAKTSLLALGNAFLAHTQWLQERFADAEIFLEKALSLPCIPIIRYRVHRVAGYLAQAQGNYDQAIAMYQKAVQDALQYDRNEPSTPIQYRLGLVYLAQQDFAQARASFQQLLNIHHSPFGQAHAQFGLAQVEAASGNTDKAIRYGQKALTTLLKSNLHIRDRMLREIKAFIQGVSGD